jgi:adenosylhomocysteine nucleosidase
MRLTPSATFRTLGRHHKVTVSQMDARMQELPNPLVVMALESENGGVFRDSGVPVLYSGVGKINAAYSLTRKLADYLCAGVPLPRVINFGTAGSGSFPPGTVVACGMFIQHDMDVAPLGFPVGTTPFDAIPAVLEFPSPYLEGLSSASCGTGDSFATTDMALSCDVIDMEAYSLAKVCWLYKAKFVCIKYITDGADGEAAAAWQNNLSAAGPSFMAIYRQLSS